jgi:IS30 family transposase
VVQSFMRLSKQTWEQIKTAYASGIGLREIARKMNVPEGTVLARAKREGWTQQIAAAKHAAALTQSNAITPMQSIAAVMQQRGERYRERIAGVSEKVIGHVEAMEADEILIRSSQLEKIDTIARRTFGLNEAPPSQGCLSLAILTNHAAVQVKATIPRVASSSE